MYFATSGQPTASMCVLDGINRVIDAEIIERCSVVGAPQTHLFNSSGHMMSDALIYRICQALETILLQEGQKGLFKHGRGAEDDDGQAVILVRQVQSGRQHGVIPANLRRRKV